MGQTAYSGINGLAGAAVGLNESIAGNNKETGKGVFGRGKITAKSKPRKKSKKTTKKTSKKSKR